MYLHIIPADRNNKFIGPIHDIFEAAAPGRHFYVTPWHQDLDFELPPYVVQVRNACELARVLRARDDWQGVIVNGLLRAIWPYLHVIPRDLNIAWVLWGHEAYLAWPRLKKAVYLPETQRIRQKLEAEKSSRTRREGAVYSFLRGIPLARWMNRRVRESLLMKPRSRDVMDRYDYCVTQIREEYDLFRHSGLIRKTKYHWGAVCTLDDYVDLDAPLTIPGPHIQVGNSAWTGNNHVDTFGILSTLDLSGRHVVTPLSYGRDDYRSLVIEYGRERLGKHFQPVLDFMPLVEYNRMLQQCGIVVMNHCRQQAVGNIVSAIWRGARVYMNDTTVYRAYKRLGFDIGLIARDLRPDNQDIFRPYSLDQVEHHREILRRFLSREKVVCKTQELLEKLAGKSHE